MSALSEKLEQDRLAYVLGDIRGEVQNSSGYLGAISDRSKELFFDKLTVGQYLYSQIEKNPNYSTRNKVFYRQDYLDEFERIWEKQKEFHPELTDELKSEIRDVVIFYQRRLKSQKGLISYCEFEHKDVLVDVGGVKKIRQSGCRVAPRSSLLFQEFKIWSVLNNVILRDKCTGEEAPLSVEEVNLLADELSVHPKLSVAEALKAIGRKPRAYSVNYTDFQGNVTLSTFYEKFFEIVAATGHEEYDLAKLSAPQAKSILNDVFGALGFNTDVLSFDSSLPKEEYEQQAVFKLWHLLYSYEGDSSKTGDESLVEKIAEICRMPKEFARILASVKMTDDYASLSHKAMRKILPFLKQGQTYDKACALAGYNHSSSITKEENEERPLVDKLEILPKGALRNPVVEKILNQMVNVVNAVAQTYGKPDEIHIELARELKHNAKQRAAETARLADRTKENENIKKILQEEFGISAPKPKDIIRYRLFEELREIGYKTLYSHKYISREKLFSKEIDIEHIIPQALLFDDSFTNKTLEFRDVNIEKGKETAFDYVSGKYGPAGVDDYKLRVNELRSKNAISERKQKYLLMRRSEIPEDFVNRDLTNSQYIARKSSEMLHEFVRTVVSTSGEITKYLRDKWQLVDVMSELNLPKYRLVGRTYWEETQDGAKEKITDWTKRNDHRHHAMDAITIAFTKPSHIQVLNTLNADKGTAEYALREQETTFRGTNRILAPPMPLDELRAEFKSALESTLVSIKSKNKVATRNVNKTKSRNGTRSVTTLTPRGQLHKEQVYGLRRRYETFDAAVGSKMTAEVIAAVASKDEREALSRRLAEFGGDPKKAFAGKNSPAKNPVYVDSAKTRAVPAKVKCVRLVDAYSIRKDVAPDLTVSKVIDGRVRRLLEARLAEYGGDPKKAFANLQDNPIWVDKEKGVQLKRVTILENFNLCAIRDKRDKDGRLVLDRNGNTVPNDFVNPKNNHHVAIYCDADGNYQERVVTLLEALQRETGGLPVVDKNWRHEDGWKFVFSMKINEMFVFPNQKTGFVPSDIDLTDPKNYAEISPNLFRVQKLSSGDYWFRHHLESQIEDNMALKDFTWKRITSLNSLKGAVKVRIDHIGRIVDVGEY